MLQTLFSTSCYIETDLYLLHICIEVNSDENSLPFIGVDEAMSSILHFPVLIQIQLKSTTDQKSQATRKTDAIIPATIFFNRLLSIKMIERMLNKDNGRNYKDFQVISSIDAQIEINYVHISESLLWSVKKLSLGLDFNAAEELCTICNKILLKFQHRPRRLLVFINPNCGKGKGRSIYEKKVQSLFEDANIIVNTIYTEYANHARDYILEKSLDDYDGLVCVGGDGMFSELCHGLLLKVAQQAQLNMNDPNVKLIRPKLRVGIIPAGSTDAVVFSTTGYNDPITSTLQIIVGESVLIDLATVHNESGFIRFMATMFAYGFFGNIIQQSNRWRWLGPLRYTLAGVFQFIRNRSYHTTLTISQPPQPYTSERLVNNLNRCLLGKTFKASNASKTSNNETLITDEQVYDEDFCLPRQIYREGDYETVNCLNMSCRCDQSKYGMSPSVHLGDGSFDLILVKRSWYLNFFRFLHHVAEDGRTIDDLPNVERFRATEVHIRPIVCTGEKFGNWSCDGELIMANEVKVRAHCQALNLFATGIRLDQIKKIHENS